MKGKRRKSGVADLALMKFAASYTSSKDTEEKDIDKEQKNELAEAPDLLQQESTLSELSGVDETINEEMETRIQNIGMDNDDDDDGNNADDEQGIEDDDEKEAPEQ